MPEEGRANVVEFRKEIASHAFKFCSVLGRDTVPDLKSRLRIEQYCFFVHAISILSMTQAPFKHENTTENNSYLRKAF